MHTYYATTLILPFASLCVYICLRNQPDVRSDAIAKGTSMQELFFYFLSARIQRGFLRSFLPAIKSWNHWRMSIFFILFTFF